MSEKEKMVVQANDIIGRIAFIEAKTNLILENQAAILAHLTGRSESEITDEYTQKISALTGRIIQNLQEHGSGKK